MKSGELNWGEQSRCLFKHVDSNQALTLNCTYKVDYTHSNTEGKNPFVTQGDNYVMAITNLPLSCWIWPLTVFHFSTLSKQLWQGHFFPTWGAAWLMACASPHLPRHTPDMRRRHSLHGLYSGPLWFRTMRTEKKKKPLSPKTQNTIK